jgi:hypothetical protein
MTTTGASAGDVAAEPLQCRQIRCAAGEVADTAWHGEGGGRRLTDASPTGLSRGQHESSLDAPKTQGVGDRLDRLLLRAHTFGALHVAECAHADAGQLGQLLEGELGGVSVAPQQRRQRGVRHGYPPRSRHPALSLILPVVLPG